MGVYGENKQDERIAFCRISKTGLETDELSYLCILINTIN